MINQDYKEILQCLEKHDVAFMLVGAYAMAAHGFPRSTGDIDIWVNPMDENSIRVYQALAEFGAPLSEISEQTFSYLGIVFQIGVAPCRIDILTRISGDIDFSEAYENCITTNIEGVVVKVLGIKDLIKNKESIGRAKDEDDVIALRKIHPT